ncbi:MAG: DUF4145 domain-containing protein [Planctomycetes bacterium]|nr:DUF4145 domain-containing protein [Planctomycetota bacterium]
MDDEYLEKGYYKHDLKIQLETCIDVYEQDREEYWAEEHDRGDLDLSKLIYEQTERFGDRILKNTEDLVSEQPVDEDLEHLDSEFQKLTEENNALKNSIISSAKCKGLKPSEIEGVVRLFSQLENDPPKRDSKLRLVWERLCIKLAWDMTEKVEVGANRILQLYNLGMETKPFDTTLVFLRRVSRCFIWGFDPECVILCRGVIDSAFRSAVDDEICKRHIRGKPPRFWRLFDRIKAAFKEGLISKDAKDAAYRIKTRGNNAVHHDPNIYKHALDTIRDTLLVLEELGA